MVRFEPGAIVEARGREWIVLPHDTDAMLRLRPLTGIGGEETGVFDPVEPDAVRLAAFPLPDPAATADASGIRALLDAARLSLRAGAAPFRSLGRIAVAPRPYQFVPLLMVLRLERVRLLLADDVGVGKTVEAGLIAKELLERGLARRLAVLCPAHLGGQWVQELEEKFALPAELIQPATLARLERRLPRSDISAYGWPQALVTSIDFVKAGRQKEAFLAHAPDLVIVDEAHGAARPRGDRGRGQQLRHELLRELMARDPHRHLILVTATPHSGIEESFRSLLGLLDPALEPVGGAADRKRLVPHIVQRRRQDVERWLGTTTPFPERQASEATYQLGAAYTGLFQDVLDYCREAVATAPGERSAQRRVRHWAAIGLLRCLLSSPAAAEAVLRHRAGDAAADDEDGEGVDARYRPQVADDLGDAGDNDHAPTAPFEDGSARWTDGERRRLRDFDRRAAALAGPAEDAKLARCVELLAALLREGRCPIVFCRFIATADYLATRLQALLRRQHRTVEVRAVTGDADDDKRREIVKELVAKPVRVLVATDCLSEGINLQEHFDAVLHYDLPWNPNRLEQREGRVDRFGQVRPSVATVVLYGTNNEIDLVVLEVLVRKARAIRKALGVAVPIPAEAEQVIDAVVDSVLLRRTTRAGQYQLALGESGVSELHAAWDEAAAREGRSRAFFAQAGVQPDEVAREVEATDDVLGDTEAVRRFLTDVLPRFGGRLVPDDGPAGCFTLHPGGLPTLLGGAFPFTEPTRVVLDRTADPELPCLGRIHPAVAAIADTVLGQAFEGGESSQFARAGAVLTRAVQRVTAILLLRLRYSFDEAGEAVFAEEVRLVACEHRAGQPAVIEPLATAALDLLGRAAPAGNLEPAQKRHYVEEMLALMTAAPAWWRPVVDWRRGEIEAAHRRLRRITGAGRFTARPHTPPDIMACLVLVPAVGEDR